MTEKLLEIKHLEASIGNTKIIKDFNLEISSNQIHLIMGTNGSGKSTLSKILAGHPSYTIDKGEIAYCGENLIEKEINQRAQEGLFLAFQYPIEISGVTNYDFLRSIYNEKQKFLKKYELDPLEFMAVIQPFLETLKINLNEGFSGGEKKRNEILQMLLLNPKLIVLDEIDSGLDIDAIKTIFDGVLSTLKMLATGCSILVITHNPKVLNYLVPDFVHIMMDGKIIKSGNMELVELIEASGYQAVKA